MEDRIKLEDKTISKNCIINTYINKNEEFYILEINYLKGKFISEKIFTNDLNGVELMEETIKLFKTEYDIKEYFGIF
jgi:hypothetical protein